MAIKPDDFIDTRYGTEQIAKALLILFVRGNVDGRFQDVGR